ncbi:LPS export ABC transporter permease LptG [Desulfoprunum benzoelyticum]|uniref:Lipopolysaccharide export system permease protein n=1 Tax=Desulfoprunum benzoelyticum TaxID=1506996 RepID=A0A840UR48_9BACT|nr:LPS export ABC transporter permease LptG [Desulfoprunum benzoelyticum]MBB5348697.1 lipopolysaccharide export system permease protein [Desulfoprunum benzoelyticum]MBM9530025.1 LPS export ABC transporter permease LptG [Desulfoprunum benzoelyticum]
MRILDLYIGRTFLTYCLLIMLVLAVLLSLFELIAQFDDVGQGSYRMADAFLFVFLTLPKRILDLLPITTLLGGIVAIGTMADHGEIVGMEAAGISVPRICTTVFVTSMLLMLAAGILAEMVVPAMEQQARKSHARAISSDENIDLSRQGFWVRRGNSYIHVEKMLREGVAAGLDIFRFDDQGQLQTYTHAHSAVLQDNRQWVLHNVTQRVIDDGEISTRQLSTLALDAFLSSDQVSVLGLPPYSLSTPDLIRYIEALEESGQDADQYAIALWRKISVPLTTGIMALLALSFVFGSTRGISAGYRITIGSLVGIALYSVDQMSIQWGLLLNMSPVAVAMVPVLLISGITFVRLRQVF